MDAFRERERVRILTVYFFVLGDSSLPDYHSHWQQIWTDFLTLFAIKIPVANISADEDRSCSVILTPSEDGTVNLKLEIEESSDLSVWENNGKSVEVELPLAEGKKFLRFAMK